METVDLIRYWLGVMVIASWFPAIFPWLVIHPLIEVWRSTGKTVMWLVIAPFWIGFAVVMIIFRDAVLGPDLGSHVLVGISGVVVLLTGGVLDFRRRKYLTTKILVGNPEIDNDASNLLTGGPYAKVRHPRYVAIVLSYLGFTVLANFEGVYIYFAVSLPFLWLVVVLEEKELHRRFGKAYGDYAAKTPRFIPGPGKG